MGRRGWVDYPLYVSSLLWNLARNTHTSPVKYTEDKSTDKSGIKVRPYHRSEWPLRIGRKVEGAV